MSELEAKQAAIEILKRDLTKQDEIIRELTEALREIYDAWPGHTISSALELQLLEKVTDAIEKVALNKQKQLAKDNLAIFSEFLVDIEDMAKDRGILPFIGISENLGDDIWYVLCNFQIGRKASPPKQSSEDS